MEYDHKYVVHDERYVSEKGAYTILYELSQYSATHPTVNRLDGWGCTESPSVTTNPPRETPCRYTAGDSELGKNECFSRHDQPAGLTPRRSASRTIFEPALIFPSGSSDI